MKVVLTVIAVCLSALTLTVIDLPEFATEAEATVAPASSSAPQDLMKPGGETGPVGAPAATLPLRWKVSWAVEDVTAYCGTAVIVTNDTASTVNVQVEWFHYTGTSRGYSSLAVIAFGQRIWVSSGPYGPTEIDPKPYYPDQSEDLGYLLGYARVHADDPRIQVAAVQYCRDGLDTDKNIVTITQIPVRPVGATMEYFQAGMPATWTPPMVVPEVPE